MQGLAATLVALCLMVCLSVGCAESFPRPLTATRTAQLSGGAALVHYLGQPNATATICSRDSRGPYIGSKRSMTRSDLDALTGGLANGDVAPELWRRCAGALLASLSAPESASLLDAMGMAYRTLLRDSDFEKPGGGAIRARLESLHQVYVFRPTGVEPHPATLADLLADLRDALSHSHLGPLATSYGDDLLATVDLANSVWHAQPVTRATLDVLQAQKDEALLHRFSLRLADPELRTDARRRIVELHLAASTWPEVREHAAEVETAVLATGRNAVDLAQHPPLRASLDLSRSPIGGVLVRQDVRAQVETLLGYGGKAPGLSVVAELDLHDALNAELSGVSRPASLCAAPEALDVTPCLLPQAVVIDNPVAYLDGDARLHLSERVSSRTMAALVSDHANLSLPIEVGGRALVTSEWPLYFERPESLVFRGSMGEPGPKLRVGVEQGEAGRLVFTVEGEGQPLIAVLESRDAHDPKSPFAIVSQGGDGADGNGGLVGANGSDGSPGSSASCPLFAGGNGGGGSDGGNGGNGGNGSSGGAGGDIAAVVTGKPVDSDPGALVGLLKRIVRSEGGRGGEGGAGGEGGQGGRGGAGGSGTTCTNSDGSTSTLAGGLPGHDGTNGMSGQSGSHGTDGSPGNVQFVTR